MQRIVPLNVERQSENGLAKAVPPKQRAIDLRIGDWVRQGAKVSAISRVRAYCEAFVADEGELPSGGWTATKTWNYP